MYKSQVGLSGGMGRNGTTPEARAGSSRTSYKNKNFVLPRRANVDPSKNFNISNNRSYRPPLGRSYAQVVKFNTPQMRNRGNFYFSNTFPHPPYGFRAQRGFVQNPRMPKAQKKSPVKAPVSKRRECKGCKNIFVLTRTEFKIHFGSCSKKIVKVGTAEQAVNVNKKQKGPAVLTPTTKKNKVPVRFVSGGFEGMRNESLPVQGESDSSSVQEEHIDSVQELKNRLYAQEAEINELRKELILVKLEAEKKAAQVEDVERIKAEVRKEVQLEIEAVKFEAEKKLVDYRMDSQKAFELEKIDIIQKFSEQQQAERDSINFREASEKALIALNDSFNKYDINQYAIGVALERGYYKPKHVLQLLNKYVYNVEYVKINVGTDIYDDQPYGFSHLGWYGGSCTFVQMKDLIQKSHRGFYPHFSYFLSFKDNANVPLKDLFIGYRKTTVYNFEAFPYIADSFASELSTFVRVGNIYVKIEIEPLHFEHSVQNIRASEYTSLVDKNLQMDALRYGLQEAALINSQKQLQLAYDQFNHQQRVQKQQQKDAWIKFAITTALSFIPVVGNIVYQNSSLAIQNQNAANQGINTGINLVKLLGQGFTPGGAISSCLGL